MIFGAAGLLLHNRQESEQAASISARILPEISAYVEAARETATLPPLMTDPAAQPRQMTVASIDGHDYIGVLSIPAIGYESQVLAEWSYPLLELGAGFEREYTARENIYLYGAILGYTKEFIESKFDEIVEFSELKKFVDVPIKNYSSVPSSSEVS